MGNPFFNEALVALKDKDNYNRTSPPDDAATFKTYALKPELAFLINLSSLALTRLTTKRRVDLAARLYPGRATGRYHHPTSTPGRPGRF